MKVLVHDKATGAIMVKRENAEPHQYCECCGYDEPYMYICDNLVLCRTCAKDWKRLGIKRFLKKYWFRFDYEEMEKRCLAKEN